MDKSPIYGGVDRFTYGRNGIQAFIETDLFVTGALGDKFVFELDYVFAGYPDNILTNPAGVSLEPEAARWPPQRQRPTGGSDVHVEPFKLLSLYGRTLG